MRHTPEKTVMNDQQVNPGDDGFADRGRRGIDGGGDPRHAAAILHLQAVHRAGPVLERLRLEDSIAVSDDFVERDLGHAGERTNPVAPSQAGNTVRAVGVLTFGGRLL